MSFNKLMAEQAIALLRKEFKLAVGKADAVHETPEGSQALRAAENRFAEVVHLLEVVSGTAPPMHDNVLYLGSIFDDAKNEAVSKIGEYGTSVEHEADDLEKVMQVMEEARDAVEQADLSAAMVMVHLSRAYRLLEK